MVGAARESCSFGPGKDQDDHGQSDKDEVQDVTSLTKYLVDHGVISPHQFVAVAS
jgi:hypothetical protein